ncbi:membrane protein [Paenibacillus darwinianus]|uniref:Putative manganese efflux pump MntP n=1 Tax=Paenibacillus darwinianus TaxID=1380763 RepID=A0A9W5W795_9BACL|nr:manganese efflux pump [Paenibacillus darwinianus]EXX87385.1 membrane protein [Paenibacillus darwinianus]EXX87432.1 membrane protein [Paenibacillus darwinianus]EXX88841.1 membrane protein [Paenibacillus darwinianus]
MQVATDAAIAGTGQVLTVLVMAVALGMDAFSLGIGIGLKGIRKLDILKLSLIIALFHIWMPLMGMYTGQYMSMLLGGVAVKAGGALLVLLGGHMIYSSLRGDAVQLLDHRTIWGALLFALSVSVDSFSVGVSLGMFATDIPFTVLTFGFFGGMMSILGLLLGRRVGQSLGEYGEACGGVILFAFGVLFLI